MSDPNVVLTDAATNTTVTLPVVKGSLGDPAVRDHDLHGRDAAAWGLREIYQT